MSDEQVNHGMRFDILMELYEDNLECPDTIGTDELIERVADNNVDGYNEQDVEDGIHIMAGNVDYDIRICDGKVCIDNLDQIRSKIQQHQDHIRDFFNQE